MKPKLGQTWRPPGYISSYELIGIRHHWWYGKQYQIESWEEDWWTFEQLIKKFKLVEDVPDREKLRYINVCSLNTLPVTNAAPVTLMQCIREVAPFVLVAVGGAVATGLLISFLVKLVTK